MDLSEPPHTGLGYGGSSRSGSSRPDEVREAIMATSKEIIDLGSSDPEMISLMGFFEENVGPDTISDFTSRVILNDLAEVTYKFCRKYKVPLEKPPKNISHELPYYKNKPIVLVPKDIVRDLPIARDWHEVEFAVMKNNEIRERVNKFLGGIAKPTVVEKKQALKEAALGSAGSFNGFLNAVKECASSYDPNIDSLAYYKLKEILSGDIGRFRSKNVPDIDSGPEFLQAFVVDTVKQFKHHVEKGNLWEELWINEKPKKERAAQLIYFAIADCYCRANNVDISPEANMGGGPVDFKFSKGYNARVLVELKKSTGTVVHGYEKQLDIYKDASRTSFGVFVVVDYGDSVAKINAIRKIRADRLQKGESASEIIVIDASKKTSASKRR